MSVSNRERVGRALELLNTGLKPYVAREMEAAYGARWRYEAVSALRDHHFTEDGQDIHLDNQALFLIMWNQWNYVFGKSLGQAERNYVSELRTARNNWAHDKLFSTDDTYRVLDTIQRLLTSILAADLAAEVEQQKTEMMRIRYDDQARNLNRRNSGSLVANQVTSGLPSWREIIAPHPDVAAGRFQLAEYAADLAQVHRGGGSSEYNDPYAFFQRTFLTNGLRQLLLGALHRLSGTGGDPIVELQTNFGGGKTHSLLSLYHLFSGVPAGELVGIDSLLQEVGLQQPPKTQRAVLVGHALSLTQPQTKPDGCVVRTIWGEMAWQLLGKEGYALVAEDDLAGVSPGSETLRQLFVAASPALILIDEWVVFVRQLYGKEGLAAGSFEANLSFAQNLTEAAKATPQTMIVAAIPASDTETGGEGGQEAAIRLRKVFGRVESPWRPADPEEGFEIVRRRLFEPISDPQLFAARDAVAKRFATFYREQRQEFPSECSEADYERRIKSAYPIHPELFDRLFNDWSSIEKFQRTRGVLRLMATVVHELWVQQDHNPLIMPSSVPIYNPLVQSIFTQYLEDNWVPVIEKDIDGNQSLPLRLDNDNTNFGRFSASRRVSRTIFFGSAPTKNSANKGIQDIRIKLGSVLPGDNVGTFGDALRRLTDQATYLYQSERRYWYDTQASVTRLAQDRATQYDDDTVYEKIKGYLKIEQPRRGDFASVHLCPDSGADVVDNNEAVRLVILKPQYSHARRDSNTSAITEAKKILDFRGNAPRTNRNTLVFAAADRTRVEELKQATCLFLAWDSIATDQETLNLDAFQRKQVNERRKDAEDRIRAMIPETYSWVLVPEQANPRQKSEAFSEHRLQGQREQGTLADYVSSLLRTEEQLITQLSGVRLRIELDRIPLWRGNGNHVAVADLVKDFATFVYLPRLKNKEVLLSAIRDGVESETWAKETFAYADGWDEARQRYQHLRAHQTVTVATDGQSLLVKAQIAEAQLEAEARELEEKRRAAAATAQAQAQAAAYADQTGQQPSQVKEFGPAIYSNIPRSAQRNSTPAVQKPLQVTEEKHWHRFYGTVQINERMMASEAGRIMEEIVQHLTSLSGAKVKVTIDIEAELPDGAPEHVVRTVKENGNTLRFQNCEFEEN